MSSSNYSILGSQYNDAQDALLTISALANESNRPCGSGSMSPSIYDTAWLAMISQDIDGETCWTFPECFQYLLETQLESGGWVSYASQVDGILNTMGALLALLKHSTTLSPSPRSPAPWNSELRISNAKQNLQSQLQQWDVDVCDHVGFEYLVPALMTMLECYDISFSFPGKELLLELNQMKMAKFRPELFYGSLQTTALHSLEAFIGKIDFDRIGHQKCLGSIMASPASTAAYLMGCSTWDQEAESYLRSVITGGTGRGNGGVACAFPTTIFEVTWVLSALLSAGFTVDELGVYNVKRLSGIIEKEFQDRNGIVGFAPQLIPDADDTAKTILTLNLLGRPTSPDGMIANFEATSHFRTYPGERNASFSANCNVLNALLHVENPGQYTKQISKTTIFLCKSWMAGNITDKWNLCHQYPMMLLAQTFRKLIILWDQGTLPELPEQLITDQVLLVLFQILYKTLARQNPDGSWGKNVSCEETAYALLTLVDSSLFQWTACLDEHVGNAIKLGRDFLVKSRHEWENASYTWIEKVSYSSSVLSKTYSIAACKAANDYSTISYQCTSKVQSLVQSSKAKVTKFASFFSRIPLLESEPKWKLQSSIIEGSLFLPRLRRIRLEVFPRKDMEEDKYLEYIPFTWTACNNKDGGPLEADLLWDMMVISMLNYQADEFMETIEDIQSPDTQAIIKDLIHNLDVLPREESPSGSTTSGDETSESSDVEQTSISSKATSCESYSPCPEKDVYQRPPVMASTEATLRKFSNHVMQHPRIITASPASLAHLSNQLRRFLLAHLDHCADNAILAQQPPNLSIPVFPAKVTFYDWMQNTSAVDTSCPYSFAWLVCRTGHKNGPPPTAVASYLQQDLANHLAAMCRMYNDYGSLARDIAESNVNSLNFPEFQVSESRNPDKHETVNRIKGRSKTEDAEAMRRKKELMELAEYERSCVVAAKERLIPLVSKRVGEALGVLINVTDLYGQIYVARDIASRMRRDALGS
ncbi:uncharacterized protein BP5553_07700 [Venustampulla echinocandica]|uniref:Ent-kaurene synthase n=1 Tax=Venustampulla echinocandica TaxID=2656787 RepID=A0A370TH97_9HELO|nr:uncharacterized protein BP5553_07700 [Venustampulla echinocandica]RDL34572.1 hypothetical protein BP5553_07700 [Venustampulla echinocandica]